MKRTLCLFAILTAMLSTIGITQAQDAPQAPTNPTIVRLTQNIKDFVPSERVSVQTDRDYYRRGDTIWYRAFLHSEKDEGVSNFIYIDLIDDEQNVVSRHKVKRSVDGFYSQIPVELSIKPGGYTLRAYTYWMLNFDKQALFYKPIFITSDDLTATTKESKVELVSKNISTTIKGSKLGIKVSSKGDQYLAVYNAVALFSLQPLTKSEEIFSLELSDLPKGEIVVAIVDNKGRVVERHYRTLNEQVEQPKIDVATTTVGDKTNIKLTIAALEGNYALSVAHSDLVAPFADINSQLKKTSTIDIENSLLGRAQNKTHYIELEQALVGQIKNVSSKKLANGFQLSVSKGALNDMYIGDIDKDGRFQIDMPDEVYSKKLYCKLVEPKTSKVADCLIDIQSMNLPTGYSPFKFSAKPKAAAQSNEVVYGPADESEYVVNIDNVVIKGRSGRRPYEPFTLRNDMAQYNTQANEETYIAPQMNSRTLYEILQSNSMLVKGNQRNDSFVRAKESRFGSRNNHDEDLEPTSTDYLWTYIIDGMEYTPDEPLFNTLLGEDILTIQIVSQSHAPILSEGHRLLIAIETKPTFSSRPRTPSRNFAKLDYVGYTPSKEFDYQSRNTLGWTPVIKIDGAPQTVEFTVPSEVKGNYTVTLNGFTDGGDPVTSIAELTL